LIGDVRVEQNAGIVAVLGVAVSGRFAVSAGAEPLRVGRRRCPFAPVGGERQTVLIIHEFSEGLGVRLVADVPCDEP